jgi:hypothetical protein
MVDLDPFSCRAGRIFELAFWAGFIVNDCHLGLSESRFNPVAIASRNRKMRARSRNGMELRESIRLRRADR